MDRAENHLLHMLATFSGANMLTTSCTPLSIIISVIHLHKQALNEQPELTHTPTRPPQTPSHEDGIPFLLQGASFTSNIIINKVALPPLLLIPVEHEYILYEGTRIRNEAPGYVPSPEAAEILDSWTSFKECGSHSLQSAIYRSLVNSPCLPPRHINVS